MEGQNTTSESGALAECLMHKIFSFTMCAVCFRTARMKMKGWFIECLALLMSVDRIDSLKERVV